MSLMISDGKGRGYSAAVTEGNKLLTTGITATPEHHANHEGGNSFSVLFTATPAGAADCFLYVKNESVLDMIIEGMSIKLAANEYVDVKINDSGDPVGGSDITPVNLNSGSALSAIGVFQSGADITGLSGGGTAYRIYHASSLETKNINFEQDIILKKNGVFSLYAQTGTTEISGYIDMFYTKVEI